MEPTRSLTFAVLTLGILAAPLSARGVRQLDGETPIAPHQSIRIEFPAGELRLEAADADTLTAALEIRCPQDRRLEDCREQARSVELNTSSSGDEVLFGICGLPRFHLGNDSLSVEGTIRVPRNHPPAIEMRVGRLEIAGVNRTLTARLKVGEIRTELPVEPFGNALLRANIGEVSLRAFGEDIEGRRPSLLGGAVTWSEGPGREDLHLEVSVGEVVARLAESDHGLR